MPLVDLKAPPTATTRRWFGVSLAGLLLLLGFFLGGFFLGRGAADWAYGARMSLWCLAVAIALVYYTYPACQLAIIRSWLFITYPIAWTMGHLLLLITYLIVFLPISFVLKCTGYDPLKLSRGNSDSNWTRRLKSRSASEYFKQF
jgi:hypothetical protein